MLCVIISIRDQGSKRDSRYDFTDCGGFHDDVSSLYGTRVERKCRDFCGMSGISRLVTPGTSPAE